MVFNLPVWFGAFLLLIGVVGLVFKNQFSNMIAKVGSPLGLKVKHTLVVLAVLGIILGGWTTVSGWVGGIGTASLTDSEGNVVQGSLDCVYTASPSYGNISGSAVSFRADPSDLSNYYADVVYDSGGDMLAGYLKCTNDRPDLSKGASFDCYAVASSYKSETDTTDSNTYKLVATSTVKSAVAGENWRQTIYLGDEGTTAQVSSASDGYETQTLVFAQDEAEQYLSYNMTLPGSTAFGYLNNQSSGNLKIYCDGAEVGKLTITKTAS